MEHLPFEVLLIIASWLNPIELGTLSQVSHVLHYFVRAIRGYDLTAYADTRGHAYMYT